MTEESCFTAPSDDSSARPPLLRKRTLVLLAIVAVLLVELGTYALWAEKATVDAALGCLPEGGSRDFICLLSAGLSRDQERQLADALKARFRSVFRDSHEIPPERWIWSKSTPAKRTGVEGGFLWSFIVQKRGWLWLKVQARHWRSETDTAIQQATYVWLFATWVRVSTSQLEEPN